jgi:hypothetical protein
MIESVICPAFAFAAPAVSDAAADWDLLHASALQSDANAIQ